MKTILAPVDFSTPSELVADTAAALAQVYAGRVVLLHVVQPPMVTNDYGVGIDNLQEIIVMSEKTATKNLEKLRARLTQAGVPTEIVLHTGAPIPHILKQATDCQADFIVMGSHRLVRSSGRQYHARHPAFCPMPGGGAPAPQSRSCMIPRLFPLV